MDKSFSAVDDEKTEIVRNSDDERTKKILKWLTIISSCLAAILLLLIFLVEEQQRLFAEHEARCKKLLDKMLSEMKTAQKEAEATNGIFILRELREMFCQAVGQKNPEIMALADKYIVILGLYGEESNFLYKKYDDLAHLVETCSHCQKGFAACAECGGTRQCSRCNGNGGYYISVPSTEYYYVWHSRPYRYRYRWGHWEKRWSKKWDSGRRWTPCDPYCGTCKKLNKCQYCKGKSIKINKDGCRELLSLIHKRFQLQVEKFSLKDVM